MEQVASRNPHAPPVAFSPMELAPAVPEDALPIARVHVRSWQAAYASLLDPTWLAALSVAERAERWARILANRESEVFVSRQDQRVTGFVSLGPSRDPGAAATQGEIWSLYAAPEVWGSGTGRALLGHALQHLQASGFQSASLWVLSGNERGIRFYERCGFSRVPGSENSFELGGRQVQEAAYRRPALTP